MTQQGEKPTDKLYYPIEVICGMTLFKQAGQQLICAQLIDYVHCVPKHEIQSNLMPAGE